MDKKEITKVAMSDTVNASLILMSGSCPAIFAGTARSPESGRRESRMEEGRPK